MCLAKDRFLDNVRLNFSAVKYGMISSIPAAMNSSGLTARNTKAATRSFY
jgi:hypothetical protein